MPTTETSFTATPAYRPDRTDNQAMARIGLWGWLGLYVTGAGLLLLLLSHIGLVHYVSNEPFSASRTYDTLQRPFVRVIEVCLLVFALIHGMTGLRRVVLDLEIFRQKRCRYLTWFLVGVAAILIVWGLKIFGHLTSGG